MSNPLLTRVVATYCQNQDDAYDNDTGIDQVLTLTLESAYAGPYLVIRTERWAMDRPRELTQILRDF
jgi:hypothetical protein